MARGDWNIVEVATGNSKFKGGFEWRYANTTADAQQYNKDIIEVRMFARVVNTPVTTYNLSDLTSYLQYTIDTTTTKLNVVTDFDFRNKSKGTYYLGSSLPFRRISGAGANVDGVTIFTIEVPHNENGTAPAFNITSYWNDTATSIGSVKATADITLDAILRGSKLETIDDFNIADTLTINITKYVSTYTDNLTVKVGNTVVKTINGITNKYALVFTTAEQAIIKETMATPRTIVTFELSSFDGTTLIGTDVKNAICSDLEQSLLITVHKTSTGYQIGLNGLVDTSLEDGLQIFGKLYLNGVEIEM